MLINLCNLNICFYSSFN